MIQTERQNERSKGVERKKIADILTLINQEDECVAKRIKVEIGSIKRVVEKVISTLQKKGRVFYMGAGTSGRLGVLDASECPPTFGVSEDVFIGIIAGGDRALCHAIENKEDQKDQASIDLKEHHFSENDILIGIAASGRTPYVLGAIEYAKSIGAIACSIACVKNSLIGKVADLKIEVDTGAEIITGSTRMKAGTAQKMVLNMISTTAMIKLGKVYNGMMVDVQPTNKKLIERSISIIQKTTRISKKQAELKFHEAGKSVKVAIVMQLLQMNREQAEHLLVEKDQNIAAVIHEVEKN